MGAWRKFNISKEDQARLKRGETLPASVLQFQRCNLCGYEFKRNEAGNVVGRDVQRHKAQHRSVPNEEL